MPKKRDGSQGASMNHGTAENITSHGGKEVFEQFVGINAISKGARDTMNVTRIANSVKTL
jgi:hypothetical protein